MLEVKRDRRTCWQKCHSSKGPNKYSHQMELVNFYTTLLTFPFKYDRFDGCLVEGKYQRLSSPTPAPSGSR
jgi:hypothetical protein